MLILNVQNCDTFSNSYEHMVGHYVFYDLINKGVKKYIKNDIPVVTIEKDKYYYIKIGIQKTRAISILCCYISK